MGSNLFDMLSDLAKHPQKLADFKNDPDGTMGQYGLSAAQKDHIKSAMDSDKHHDFYKAIGDEMHDQFSDPDVFIC